jgi:hypothetical protein
MYFPLFLVRQFYIALFFLLFVLRIWLLHEGKSSWRVKYSYKPARAELRVEQKFDELKRSV